MNTQQLLDQLLGAGRQVADKGASYARQGEAYAAEKLGAENRGDFRKGAIGGAMAAGALALLLGSGAGRGLVKLGGLAALGALGYNAYKKYAGGADAPQEEAQQISRLEGPAADKRARSLLAAMISAAKADGHIDDAEREIIETRLRGMDYDMRDMRAELDAPVDPDRIAAMADSPAAAREIYAVSVMAIDIDHASERMYLDDLAKALGLPPAVARAIEADVAAKKE